MSEGGSLTASSARIPLKPKTLFARNAKSEAVYYGESYHAALTLQGQTLDVVVDTFWEDTWFSCRVVSGSGCAKACPKNIYGEDFDPYGCFTEANATFQLGNATFTDVRTAFAHGKYDNGMGQHQGGVGVDGVIGLGYLETFIPYYAYLGAPRERTHLRELLHSFSVSLERDAEFLMLNGVDEALIAEKKLTPRPIPMADTVGYTIIMTAFHVEGETNGVANGSALYPCMPMRSSAMKCEVTLTSANSHITMPSWMFEAFEDKYLPASAGCSRTVDMDQHEFHGFDRLHECPSTVTATLPRLGFTFGNTTLYLDAKDYVTSMPDDASKVIINVGSDTGLDFSLGTAFLRKFYLSYLPEERVTVYCKDGEDCKVNAVTNPAVPKDSWKYMDFEAYARSYFGNPVNATDSSKKSGSGGISQEDHLRDIIKDGETASKAIWAVAIVVALIVTAVSAYRYNARKKKRAAAASTAEATPADADADAALGSPSPSTPNSPLHLHDAMTTPAAAAATTTTAPQT